MILGKCEKQVLGKYHSDVGITPNAGGKAQWSQSFLTKIDLILSVKKCWL